MEDESSIWTSCGPTREEGELRPGGISRLAGSAVPLFEEFVLLLSA